MIEIIAVISTLLLIFIATTVFFLKLQTKLLLHFSKLERTQNQVAKELQELKKNIQDMYIKMTQGSRTKDINQRKKNHVISKESLKELICDLEQEGVLKQRGSRTPNDIIIIQEFIHHYEPNDFDDHDEIAVILDEARELIKTTGIAASHLLESKLRIPQDIAEVILDKLEEEGIVGPSDGSSHRNVFRRD